MYLLGIEQRVVCRFEAVHANEQPGVGLVGGRDFDGVIVQVWPRLILVGSGGPRAAAPRRLLLLTWKMAKLSFSSCPWILGAILF